jgi:adenosylhomocysteine nucleosidase
MKLLFIASDKMEFRGLLAHATAVREAEVKARWSRSVTLGANEALLVANGAGPDHAAAATDAGMKAFDAAAIVSTGFCGALAPELGIADLVSATSVQTADRSYATRTWERLPGLSPNGYAFRAHSGPIRSIHYVARTVEEKRNLAISGAIAVEMEAAGIAARAQSHGLPLYCIRAVTDLAGETLANDFNMALRLDGQFDTILILKGTLRHPMVRLPELFRLRKRCVRAAHVLGDFFAYSGI